jgi:hypothetical protein
MKYDLIGAGIIASAAIGFIALGATRMDAADVGAIGNGEEPNISEKMQDIDTAKKVTIVLFPKNILTLVALDEGGLWASGCHFTTDDLAHVRNLVEIIKNADLTITEPTELGWMNEPREGVSLELANGSKINLFFTINFINQGVRGYIYRLRDPIKSKVRPVWRSDASYLTSKPALPDELKSWAVRVRPAAVRKISPWVELKNGEPCSQHK